MGGGPRIVAWLYVLVAGYFVRSGGEVWLVARGERGPPDVDSRVAIGVRVAAASDFLEISLRRTSTEPDEEDELLGGLAR